MARDFQTAQLNRILAEATAAMDPPMVGRRRLKLMYVTQVGSSPPRLRFFTNVERDIPAHYLRFLATRFRESLELVGTPLLLEFRRTGRSWVQGVRPDAARQAAQPACAAHQARARKGARLWSVEAPSAFRRRAGFGIVTQGRIS